VKSIRVFGLLILRLLLVGFFVTNLFAKPDVKNIETILNNSLKILQENSDKKTKSPKNITKMLNNQSKIHKMFNVTFYSKIVKNGRVSKYILATSKDDKTTFIKLKEGSQFGLFTISHIYDSYVEYTVDGLKGKFIKPYSIISSRKDN
jgi:hypothetical protein